jgi:hypothetical protein
MPSFEIRYDDLVRDPSRRSAFHVFHVRSGDTEAILSVGITDPLRRQWRLDNRADAEEIERRVVIGHLKEHLARITALAAHRILLTARDAPDLGKDWTVQLAPEEPPYERKECKHRAGKQGEYYCSAAEEGDEWAGKTTLAICEDCGLPSTDIACSNLVHPSTRSLRGMSGPPTRQLWDVQCELGRTVSEASAAECVPGGRDCWVQTYEPEEAGVGLAPRGAEFSIAEAIDQVNAAFRTRYRQKLIVIEEARSIQDLAGECPTDDSLQHKLQVLAGLMENMPLAELLTQQEAEGSQGTIDLLQRLAARDFPTLPQQYVHNLRQINRLAAGYPRHAKVKNMERAHAELGLPYPLSDYPKAWAIVRETFIQTLRQIVLHLG